MMAPKIPVMTGVPTIAILMIATIALGQGQTVKPTGAPGMTPAEEARRTGGVQPFTHADVRFMSGMIGHHAQAIAMAAWAKSHDASPSVQTLCERIRVSQTDEIKYMQSWLAERHQSVPEPDPRGVSMPGMDHPMLMPGMLTAEQMAELDRARGVRFDRAFLVDMIAHHRGALQMVQELMSSPGSGQDNNVFAYASDVASGQSAEIDRMNHMLSLIPAAAGHTGAAH